MESSDLEKKCIKFVDFCAGIGGGRLGMLEAGLSSAGFSEIDMKASDTYRLFYGDSECNYGDLMEINPDNLPDFDVLIAGFPCQTFSIVGKREGFEDYRGQVNYGLCKILKKKGVIMKMCKCELCDGKGRVLPPIRLDFKYSSIIVCPRCNGKGRISVNFYNPKGGFTEAEKSMPYKVVDSFDLK